MATPERLHVGSMIKPFGTTAAERHVLTQWCQINDDITIPQPIKLWEMTGHIEAISKKPAEHIRTLGKLFRNSGIYIARRLDAIDVGKSRARNMAKMFYRYGNALLTGTMERHVRIKDIAKLDITDQGTEDVERFLAGNELYEARRKKVQKDTQNQVVFRRDTEETARRASLAQFFRVTEQAVQLEKQKQSQKLRTHPLFSASTVFLNTIKWNMKHAIQTPTGNLFTSIFERGLHKMQLEMKAGELENNKLFGHLLKDRLRVPKKKKALDRAMRSGSTERQSAIQLEIASAIHQAVASFKYESGKHQPVDILHDQKMNCLGACMLAGAFLDAIGLPYIDAVFRDHISIAIPLSNGQVMWYEMNDPEGFVLLSDDMLIDPTNPTASAVRSILDFAARKISTGPILEINPEAKSAPDWWGQTGQYVQIMSGGQGQLLSLLNNIADGALENSKIEEALISFGIAITLFPEFQELYEQYGKSLASKGKFSEAITSFKRGIKINPDAPNIGWLFMNLAEVYADVKNTEGAIQTKNKALTVDSDLYWYLIFQAIDEAPQQDKDTINLLAEKLWLSAKHTYV